MDEALGRFLRLLLWSVPVGMLAAALDEPLDGRPSRSCRSPGSPTRRAPSTSTNLRRRVPVRGADDELDEVAQAFNETLGRVEEAVGEMRQFSTAIAHELRTPIAALRGETELAADGGADRPTSYRRGWRASSNSSISSRV